MFSNVSILLLITLATIATGCASASRGYDHMSTDDFQRRPQLTQSLLGSSDQFAEPAIQKILSTRVAFPRKVTLAIVRLSTSNEGLGFQKIDQELVDKFYNKENWGTRVLSVIPVPQMMIAKPATLTNLRQAAVLLQADALLIIKPVSCADWRFQWFEEDKAKATSTLEVLLLDTRTNIVPFTTLVSETVELKKEKTDYSAYETMDRVKKASELKALVQVAPAVRLFI